MHEDITDVRTQFKDIKHSIKYIWQLALPLILSGISGGLMTIADRFFLAHYSIDAMNGAVISANICGIFVMAIIAIASIAEVFVGQYNGARKFSQVAKPVWQMIWFSLFLYFLSVPLGLYGGKYLLPNDLYATSGSYFSILLSFAPNMALIAALSSFFIGRGLAKIVTISTIAANILNIFLNYFLIFGIENWLEPMGATGAALSTIIAEFSQIILLSIGFLSSNNQQQFGTRNPTFDSNLFRTCLIIGLPNCIAHVIEMSGWAFLNQLAANKGTKFFAVYNFTQTMIILVAYINDGLQKAVTAIGSNIIGADLMYLITRLLKSAMILNLFIVSSLLLPLIFFPETIIKWSFGTQYLNDPYIIKQAVNSFKVISIYAILDGTVWILAGLLTAAGDTLFIMVASSLNVWLCGVLPAYLYIQYFDLSTPSGMWAICSIYGVSSLITFYIRYKMFNWKRKSKII